MAVPERASLGSAAARTSGRPVSPADPGSAPPVRASVVVGRAHEQAELAELISLARCGEGAAIVLRGRPGVGKTLLVDAAEGRAGGVRVIRANGVRSETPFAYSGLHQLVAPLLGEGLDRLERPHRDALRTALRLDGETVAPEPPAELVHLGVLTLLVQQAWTTPLLAIVEDVEWLDEASLDVVAYVARRLRSARIACLLTTSSVDRASLVDGIRTLEIGDLSTPEAARVLASAAPGIAVGADVRDRLVEETGGNPGALLELVRGLTVDELTGASPLREPLPIGRSLQGRVLRDVRTMPAETQLLLLVLAAADPPVDASLLNRAARRLHASLAGLRPAEERAIVRVGEDVAFADPVTRMAVYSSASPTGRRRVHRALASAMEDERDADRRAWHRAVGQLAPAETLASELDRAVGAAKRRAGYAAVGTFLARSAELTPDRDQRAARALGAVSATVLAGNQTRAAALLARCKSEFPDELHRAQARALEASLAMALGTMDGTTRRFLESAQTFAALDGHLTRETYLEALESALWAGRLGPIGVKEAARACARASQHERRGVHLLLEGVRTLVLDGHRASAAILRRAIGGLGPDDVRWLGLAGHVASELWDDAALADLATRRVEIARENGAMAILPDALLQAGGYEVLVGRLDVAEERFAEAEGLASTTGNEGIVGPAAAAGRLEARAWSGDEDGVRSLAQVCDREATARGIGVLVNFASHACAVLHIAMGRYEAALTCAEEACEGDPFWVATRSLPDLIEAAVRSDERTMAVRALRRLRETVDATRTAWGMGMLERSRALLEGDDGAEVHYRASVSHLTECRVAPQLARTRLLFGEWLRRQRRPRDARAQLRSAYAGFRTIGADAFADRARVELLASGEHAEPIGLRAPDVLTPQERRIAELARDGASNRDIAAQLFISRYTVEYHLKKVFSKLGIVSRTELGRALPEG
jgi:DNA-binding CsgD family transcriptional regulator